MRISVHGLMAAALVLMAGPLPAAEAGLRMPSLFSDNMVLQRDRPLPVWGWAQPEQKVTVTFMEQTASTLAGENGEWQVRLNPVKAGGPYSMTVAGKETVTFAEVMVGDVWVCSGQSNMYWPVKDSMEPEREIAAANHPAIRLFTVPRTSALQPQDNVTGTWVKCSPTTISGFSAVAYFFGREIHAASAIPIGLVHSSVGGTAIEPWMSPKGLADHPSLRPMLDEMNLAATDFDAAYGNYRTRMKDWEMAAIWNNAARRKSLEECVHPDFDDSTWAVMTLPEFWEGTGLMIDGLVWFRKAVDVPKAWKGQDLLLSIRRVDDYDETYFNGICVGKTSIDDENPWTIQREYRIPAEIVKRGTNLIAVRVVDVRGNGGLPGAAENMHMALANAPEGESIPLSGEWRYQVELQVD